MSLSSLGGIVELTDLSPPSGSSLQVKTKTLLNRIGRRHRSFEGVVLKTLILFAHSGGLDMREIDVGRRPTGDASVPGGG
jgi:hypothetical protein